MVNGYENKSDKIFVDVLKAIERDVNVDDDAYHILVKEY